MGNSNDINPDEQDDDKMSPSGSALQNQGDSPLNLEQLQREIEILRADNRSRKKETTALKTMLYVGMLILMIGFFYSSETLQDAQELNMKSRFSGLQDQVNFVEKELFRDFLNLEEQIEKSHRRPSPSEFRDTLRGMNASINSIEPRNPETRELIDAVLQNSMEFMEVYEQYGADE